MNKEKARAFLKWLFYDPLQFWILIIIIIFQWSVIFIFRLDPKSANNYFGPIIQIIGGYIVLKIINGNIELFKYVTLVGVFNNWVNSCPLFKKAYKIDLQGSIKSQNIGLKAILTTKRKCNTIDELNEELHRQIDETKKLVSETESILLKRLATIEEALKIAVEENSRKIQVVDNKTTEASIGDFKWEILGAFLVIYGGLIVII